MLLLNEPLSARLETNSSAPPNHAQRHWNIIITCNIYSEHMCRGVLRDHRCEILCAHSRTVASHRTAGARRRTSPTSRTESLVTVASPSVRFSVRASTSTGTCAAAASRCKCEYICARQRACMCARVRIYGCCVCARTRRARACRTVGRWVGRARCCFAAVFNSKAYFSSL